MKTFKQLLYMYLQPDEFGFSTISANVSQINLHHKDLIKQAVNEAFRMASERAKTVKNGNSGSWYDAGINQQSILSLAPQIMEELNNGK